MDADVAVIGTGSIGAMSLWQLARAGLRCLGFEQYAPGHDQAAAGGESRIFRTTYLEGPSYVPLLLRAQELWRELEAASGWSLLRLCGGLMIGSPDSPGMRNVLDSAESFDLPHEVLDTATMGRRYPQHRLCDGEIAVLDHQAGVLRPEFAVLAAAQAAERAGATVLRNTAVREIHADPGGVRVVTADREYTVAQAVVSPGPWTARFAPALAAHVATRRLVMTWYPARDVAAFHPDRFPVFIRDSERTRCFGIPTLDGGSVKVAPHAGQDTLGDPSRLDRTVAPADLAGINRIVAEGFTGLDPTPVRVSVYMDAYSDDGHGLVGRLPGTENVWLLGAFSGHGFKLAPVFGQVARDLVVAGKTGLPIEHLAPERFLR